MQPVQQERVSGIPITPRRSRDTPSNATASYRNGHVHARTPKNNNGPRFENLLNQRPDVSVLDHLSLPEDHLEDIIAWALFLSPTSSSLASKQSKTN
jgi:hypothetical protein